jgi:hypothetical protein
LRTVPNVTKLMIHHLSRPILCVVIVRTFKKKAGP